MLSKYPNLLSSVIEDGEENNGDKIYMDIELIPIFICLENNSLCSLVVKLGCISIFNEVSS
jgi:hypothetical protein